MGSVLVHSGCCDRIAQTEWFIYNRKFISHSSGGWLVQHQVARDFVSGDDLLSSSQSVIFLLCPQMAEGVRGFSRVFNKALVTP